MTLVPPPMAILCRNGLVFPTFEWLNDHNGGPI
jgi:hypothetical protein